MDNKTIIAFEKDENNKATGFVYWVEEKNSSYLVKFAQATMSEQRSQDFDTYEEASAAYMGDVVEWGDM